eukprot:TRINITY_DN70014_c0_g1_i1.p1 TRINITY_DN70014_c0_g1~~TRINITY_DN70014_c0_g1_i1.p1  ORF type:complete len:615 (-),score=163.24 TRINITY_DN70014_c0_g1_i1:31-1875(-)
MATGEVPGSKAALLALVDRINRLTQNEQVGSALPPMDLEQLQHRAQEATQTLELCSEGGADVRPAEASVPALCGLAVECVNVVERAELTTAPARLVAAGCEVLAGLLVDKEGWSFDWIEDTLEDLSDQIDFLALEVYCGLGRLESMVTESDELPVVLDPVQDGFGAYWGTIEHRQALQELSAWLLCVLFRALGYVSVTARGLMEFVNHDLLCLCALLRGLFSTRADDSSLPHDAAEIQGIALDAMTGLTAPELAFPFSDGSEAGIEEQNRTLDFYLEVLCAAVIETGLLQASLEAALARASSGQQGAATGAKYLAFLAALLTQAPPRESAMGGDDYGGLPAERLRNEVFRRADCLGRLLEAVLSSGFANATRLRELVASCASLAASLAAASPHPDGSSDDGFTLSCRMLLSTCLDAPLVGCSEVGERAAMLAALAALANNVGDLEVSKGCLLQHIGQLPPEEQARARARLLRHDRHRLLLCGSADALVALFGSGAPQEAAPAVELPPPPPPPPAVAAKPAPAAPAGLRDIIQNAPKEFRCPLDRKLLCDPVVSPGGVVFERSTLARWLQKHGNQCPITGDALCLEDCKRSPELRKQVTDWVRKEGRHRPGKKKQ